MEANLLKTALVRGSKHHFTLLTSEDSIGSWKKQASFNMLFLTTKTIHFTMLSSEGSIGSWKQASFYMLSSEDSIGLWKQTVCYFAIFRRQLRFMEVSIV